VKLRSHHRFIEDTPRICVNHAYRLGALIAGAITELVLQPTTSPLRVILRAEPTRVLLAFGGGLEVAVALVRQPRRLGGEEIFFACPGCEREIRHLYLPHATCLCCANLKYRCQHDAANWEPLLRRAGKIRTRLGGVPGLGSPLPPKPFCVRQDYYERWIAQLVRLEAQAMAVVLAKTPM
jgi:hypothetical protein